MITIISNSLNHCGSSQVQVQNLYDAKGFKKEKEALSFYRSLKGKESAVKGRRQCCVEFYENFTIVVNKDISPYMSLFIIEQPLNHEEVEIVTKNQMNQKGFFDHLIEGRTLN